MALALCVAVSRGEDFLDRETEAGDVLYLALEDSFRRLQNRLIAMKCLAVDANERLTFQTEIPRQDAGGADYLRGWLKEHPQARLVVIDTLARFRTFGGAGQNAYDADSPIIAELQSIALANHVTILLVTHTRKMRSGDFLTDVMGSTAITGTADSVLTLERTRGESNAILRATGRDIDDQEIPLRRDGAHWIAVESDPEIGQADDSKRKVLHFVETTFGAESYFSAGEVVLEDVSSRQIRRALSTLIRDGAIERNGGTRGARYRLLATED
jgi:hypothetical protein